MTTPAFRRIMAHVSCAELSVSKPWYETLFGRPADSHPMTGLCEWHHKGSGGLQLFENPENAGHNTLTILVDNIQSEHKRLTDETLSPGSVEIATTTRLIRLNDPDDNLIVLAQPS